jgi:hypothetical protein
MSDRAQAPRASRRLALTAILLLMGTSLVAAGRAAAAWLPPVDLSRTGQNSTAPQVAVDSAGNFVAVWRRFDGANYVIQTAERPAGGAWSGPLQLSAGGQNAEAPQLAVDAAGDAVAVWSRSNGPNYIVQRATKPTGGGWGAPLDLSAPGRDAKAPQVAVDGAGRFVAVWSRSTGLATAVVQSATGVPGGAWSGPDDLSNIGRNDEPQIAVDSGGDAVAVWSHYEAGLTLIQGAVRPAGGAWEPPLPLSAPVGTAEKPQVALDAAGRAIAVWRRDDGAGYLIESAQRPSVGGWFPPAPLSAPGANAEAPQIAVDAAGNAVTVWSREVGGLSNTVIQAAIQSAGGAWQSPIDVSPPGELAEAPQVGFDAAGTAVALWTSAKTNPNVVRTSSRSPGGAWTSPLGLSNPDRGAFEPQLAFDAEGNGIAAWSRFNGTNTVIQASGYDVAGPHVAISMPRAGTVRRRISLSVSALDTWSAIGSIGWTFGDGAVANGAQVTHAFARPGTYTVTALATDALGFSGAANATISIYPKASAARYAFVRRGRAVLKLRCPSTAGCDGEAKLIAGMKVRRGKRVLGKRLQIGRRKFAVPAKSTTRVPVPISSKGLKLVRNAGRKGLKAQLTGPGVKHRIVILLARRHARA